MSNPRNLQAARIVVDKTSIAKIRKDWLGVAGNVKRVRSLEDIEKVVRGTRRWAKHIRELWVQIRDDIQSRLRQKKVNTEWANYYQKNQEPLWNFQYEVGSIPGEPDFEPKDIAEIRDNLLRGGFLSETEADDYIARKVPSLDEQEQMVVERWQENARKWARRGSRKAVKAWMWLNEFADWAGRSGFYGGGGDAPEWDIRKVENQRIEGFQTQIIGFNAQDEYHQKQLGEFKAGLKTYQRAAQQRFPWLLKHQLPLKVFFSGGPGTSGEHRAAATYNGDHIQLGFWSLTSDLRRFTQVMAHEMGHHIFRTALSAKAQKAWDQAVKGDWGPLDLRKVLTRLKPGETLRDLQKRIERDDPVLNLQLETLSHSRNWANSMDLWGIAAISKALDEGRLTPVVSVPKNPITGYSAKNTEEAFCETLGLLVAYGPRALLPDVKKRFRAVMPDIRLGNYRPDDEVVYVGVFIANMDKLRIIKKYGQSHSDLHAHHMTLWHFNGSSPRPDFAKLPWGRDVPLKVIGHAEDGKGQAVILQPPGKLRPGGVAHLTISTAPGTGPAYSKDLIRRGWTKDQGPTIKGKLGWVDEQGKVHLNAPHD